MKIRLDVLLLRLGLTVCLCVFGLFLLIFCVGVSEETVTESKFQSKHLPNRDVRMLVLNNTTSRSTVIVTQRQNRGLAGKRSTPVVHADQRAVNITIVDERQRGECMLIQMKVSYITFAKIKLKFLDYLVF